MLTDGQRVRLIEIADDALKVEVYAYPRTTNWLRFLELSEELNLHIMETIKGAGLNLSLPASVVHIQQTDATS